MRTPPPPCEIVMGSNCDKRRIPVYRHENDLVPGRGPAIWCVQGKGAAIEVRWKGKYPHTRYPTRNPIRNNELPAKLTSQNPSPRSEQIDKVYPDHANALREAGPTPPNLPIMGYLWKMQDEKLDIENEKEPDINNKKTEMSTFFLPNHVIFLHLSMG